MRRLSLALIAAALMLLSPAAVRLAYAHGGQYRGPAGEVPPDSRQPEDPPPPDNGGGTPTPPDNGGGTPTPPDNGGTPTPPDSGGVPDKPQGGGDPPQGPAGGGPGTKTGQKMPTKKGPSYDSWLFWWNYNKDEILNIKKAIKSGQRTSGGDLGQMASGGADNAAQEQNITARAIESDVVPVLQEYARNSKINFDIQSAAVLSLAKIGRKDAIPLMMEMAKNNGAEQYNKVVEESAALALGLLQDRSKQVRQFLGEVATDSQAKYRTRCFSAFALGLLGEDNQANGYAAEWYGVLKSVATSTTESSKDVTCSALVGIGLLGDRAAIPDLLEWLSKESAGVHKLGDVELSYVAAGLGKIGQPGLSGADSREVVDALRVQLTKKNRMTRYSSVIALGQVAPQADEKIQMDCVRWLTEVVKSEGKATSDSQTVNFALAALGRIAGATVDGKSLCSPAVRERALETLGNNFTDGKATSRSFAALGLGVALYDQNAALKAPYAEKIRNTLAKASGDVEQRGALCISLGLLKDIQAAPMLQSMLQDRGLDKALRGTAAVALGIIGDHSSVEVVRKVLMEKEDQKLRVDAAMAAGLLHDTQAVDTLVEILRDPKSSQFILGSVATALGQIGDQRAVKPLAEVLKDEKGQYPDLTRALACVALGQIGDKDDVPVLARLSKDVNYRAYYEAIGEVLTIL